LPPPAARGLGRSRSFPTPPAAARAGLPTPAPGALTWSRAAAEPPPKWQRGASPAGSRRPRACATASRRPRPANCVGSAAEPGPARGGSGAAAALLGAGSGRGRAGSHGVAQDPPGLAWRSSPAWASGHGRGGVVPPPQAEPGPVDKMAAGLRALRRWGSVVAAAPPSLGERRWRAFTRSAFVVKKVNNAQPNWLGVGLAFGTSAALWALLVKQHNEDVMEYERRKQARGHKCRECS
ncbi:NADH dehydrogenase [ubiquinone] 1 subunit C1, mitochondrial, partial [Onychostruthus taczanowskii]|uniref:NADH dehydrogenase [ubiquinone] 1 subunit C1, mitochondrial n=1 Tax=Onychostruthus taczanowskii TaxID=356909 RepID=UPI001B808349